MGADSIPVKTPEGHAELSTRRLRLSQRHRTVLLLVDGRRTEAQVRDLAAQAGSSPACFDELLGLSLIALPESAAAAPPAVPAEPPAAAVEAPAAAAVAEPPAGTGDRPSAPIPLVVVEDSLLPASGTLPPDSTGHDSVLSGPPPPDSWLPPDSDDDEPQAIDMAMGQVREILLKIVRAEAPVAGSLTVLRLRRARTREDLGQLLDEIEARVNKRRSLAVSQSLASARQLLARGADPSRSAA